jgi:hypothetical protein
MAMNLLMQKTLANECSHVFFSYKEMEVNDETETLYLECKDCHERRIEEFDLNSLDTQIDIIKYGNLPSLEYSDSSNRRRLRKLDK